MPAERSDSMYRPISFLLWCALSVSAFPPSAAAQPPAAPRSYRPPTLKTYVAPSYPPQAMQVGRGGVVILSLEVTAAGEVAAVSVKQGLGPELDEASLAAARKLKFNPAELDGRPISTTIDFEYRFTPPGHTHTDAVNLAAPTGAKAQEAPLEVAGVESVVVVDTERPLTAASARSVRDRDLRLRPILQPADLFRVTPGLMIVQHAGG